MSFSKFVQEDPDGSEGLGQDHMDVAQLNGSGQVVGPTASDSAEPPTEADEAAAHEHAELVDMLRHGPEIVVADEGHRMKNDDGFTSQCMELIKTRRRIVLTGYPLQNNLPECASSSDCCICCCSSCCLRQ